VKHALQKLTGKSLDFNVLNMPVTIGSDSARVRLFDRWGGSTILGPAKKSKIAGQLLCKIEERMQKYCAL
jgi:phosphopantothenoylcysteine synthetase/decarboxylase